MNEPQAAVDAVVTHYKDSTSLQACVQSLVGIPLVASITVCDGESEEGALGLPPSEIVQVLTFRENVGYGALVNAGLVYGTAPYVLVLNADTRVTAAAVDALTRAIANESNIGIVGPRLWNSDGYQKSAFRSYRPQTILYRRTLLGKTPWGRRELARFTYADRSGHWSAGDPPVDVDWLMGAALLVRREALADVGLLDPSYWMYFEDVDWCRRFWNRGWRVCYVPGAAVFHGHGRGSSAPSSAIANLLSNRLARAHLRSAVRFFRKHGTAGTVQPNNRTESSQ